MKIRYVAIIAAAFMVLGFGLGMRVTRPQADQEPPVMAVHHGDGSVTLARVSEPAPPPLPEPPGAVARARAAIVELQPMEKPSRLQFDLVELRDGTKRVTVKGPAVMGGQDFPVSSKETVHKWTAGIIWRGSEAEGLVLKTNGNWSYGASFAPIQRPTRIGAVILLRW